MGYNPDAFDQNAFSPTAFDFGASDTTPAPFSFASQTGVAPSTPIVSGAATISGIDQPAPVSITVGEYSINGGAWTSSPGSISDGEQIQVSHTSAAGHEAATNTQLTVGGVAATFTSITMALAFYRGGGGDDDALVRHVTDWWDERDKRRRRKPVDVQKKARRSAPPARPALPPGKFAPSSIIRLAPPQALPPAALPAPGEGAQPQPVSAAPYDHQSLLRAVLLADALANAPDGEPVAAPAAPSGVPSEPAPAAAPSPAASPAVAPAAADPAILDMQQSMAASMDALALTLQTSQQLKQDVTAALKAVTAALTTSHQERQQFTQVLDALTLRAQQSEQAVMTMSGQVAQALSQAFTQIGALLSERPKA